MSEKSENLKLLSDIGHAEGLSESGIKMLSRIMIAESNGDTNARPPIGEDGKRRSNAIGLFQFTPDTWSRYGKKHGDVRDPEAQIKAVIDFAKANEKSMRSAGIEPDASDFYLAHFLGVGGGDGNKGAIDIIKEAMVRPNTPIKGFLPDNVLEANGYKSENDKGVRLPLKDKSELLFEDFSVGDMNNWSSAKMGETTKFKTSISKDYKKDMFGTPDPLGNVLVASLVLGATLKATSYAYNGIKNLFSGDSPDDEVLPPPSTPRTITSGRTPV